MAKNTARFTKRPPESAPYRNPKTPIRARVADLLGRMTLEEKAAQMVCVWNGKAQTLVDENGRFDRDKARAAFGHGRGLGQVGRPSDAGGGRDAREMAELTNAIQRFFVEESRLGIPVVFHEECLHGHAAKHGTSFPQPIGLAATFDDDLVRRVFEATAAEARSRGAHQALTPVVDVARDPRWGRVEETYGEDPYLVSRMGVAAVRGFQGDARFRDKRRLIATLKHFAAHGWPESGLNCAPANVGPRVLRDVFLFPFREAVREGVMSVMASYNEIDGMPSHANAWLLRDVLRREWGFKGTVVSDYYAIRELAERPELYGHHLAADGAEAALLAVKAGVNIELPEPDCYANLAGLVKSGRLREKALDGLVSALLEQKFRAGLFDDPYVDPDEAAAVTGCAAHAALALEAARKTVILLRNEGGLAPLRADRIRTIAVIGPNADRELLGGYSGRPRAVSTVLQGIRERAGSGVEVLYHEGCKITKGGSWQEDAVTPSDPEEDRRSIAEAAEVAGRADVVVLAIGGNEQTSREAWALNHLGDRADLEMVGLQDALVNAVAATGKPIVAFLFNGRPLSVRNLAEKAAVIFECWYLGQETGRAVAEILFGDACPGGKLPITVPRSVGHVPAFYNHKPSARRGYLFESADPLFAFGYGLSYARFRIGPPALEKARIRAGGSTRVSVAVTNEGPVAGDEVVQMYVQDRVSSATRPVRELRGFRRVALDPGETKTVSFEIGPRHLEFHGADLKCRVEPGEFEILVGSSSRMEDLQGVLLTVVK
jgi:beta-glucosidase